MDVMCMFACSVAGEGKMYAPGNLRATGDNPQYEKLLNYYVQEKYTLRCVTFMVNKVL